MGFDKKFTDSKFDREGKNSGASEPDCEKPAKVRALVLSSYVLAAAATLGALLPIFFLEKNALFFAFAGFFLFTEAAGIAVSAISKKFICTVICSSALAVTLMNLAFVILFL